MAHTESGMMTMMTEPDLPIDSNTHMQPMVLEDLPTFAQTKSPSYVGKYIIHRAYGIYIYIMSPNK